MTYRAAPGSLLCCTILAAALTVAKSECDAAEPTITTNGDKAAVAAPSDARFGGVLQESFAYHRNVGPNAAVQHPTIAPTSGWYGYGFPVKTYRWGWFGAEHYYPRVVWHRGYNSDHYRWSYRRGY